MSARNRGFPSSDHRHPAGQRQVVPSGLKSAEPSLTVAVAVADAPELTADATAMAMAVAKTWGLDLSVGSWATA